MPTEFEVEIRLADNQIKIVPVKVEKFRGKKHFIGGYWSMKNGMAYDHAFS